MASKSIIDRVLLLAAAVCAAGLIWQLTVLLTSKGRMPAAHGVDMASSAAAATGSPAPPVQPPAKPDAVEPAQAPVRVVYPDADTPKTTAKITEAVPSATTSPPAALSPPAAPAAVSAAATPDASSNSPPTTGVIPVAMVAPISKPSATPAPAEAAPRDAAPVAASPAAATPASAPAPDRVASAEPAAQPDTPVDPAPAAPTPIASQVININSASVEALNRLRGGGHIGQAIAKHRPYRSVDDLMRKRVLRRDVFERIRGQIAAK